MRKSIGLVMALCILLIGCQSKPQESAQEETQQEATEQEAVETEPVEPIDRPGEYAPYVAKEGDILIDIDVEGYGVITVALLPELAPITANHFAKLVENGTFDGLTFHRIMVGFMMQGGQPHDPSTELETIEGEFESNGHENSISHTRGAISMARTMEPNSASQQFFIVQENSTFLDGDYAGFGYVTEGIELVDKICEEAVVIDNNGTVPPENQPIINSITLK